MIDRKIALVILTNTDCALLPVQNLKITVIALHPVHHIERKIVPHCVDNFITLLIFIDKLPLKCRTDIQSAAIGNNAILCAIDIPLYDFTDRDLMQFDLHAVSCFLRMKIRL